MKQGKVSENVLKRSILKHVSDVRSEVSTTLGVGNDCAVLRFMDGNSVAVSTDPVIGALTQIGPYGIYKAINNLAAAGAEPVGVMLSMLLPDGSEESNLQTAMKDIKAVCKAENLEILGGHTEVSKAVNEAVITVTGVGKLSCNMKPFKALPGNDVIITKWIGLEGTAIIAKAKEALLIDKFPTRMINEAKCFEKLLSVVPEAAGAVKSGVTAMHDVSKGGVFAALWELAESNGVGLEIELKKIPIKQETVEICNLFDINPYELISGGSLLMTAEDGNRLVLDLQKEGIPAAVIGKVTDSNDRVIYNGDIKRFLEPSKADELLKVM